MAYPGIGGSIKYNPETGRGGVYVEPGTSPTVRSPSNAERVAREREQYDALTGGYNRTSPNPYQSRSTPFRSQSPSIRELQDKELLYSRRKNDIPVDVDAIGHSRRQIERSQDTAGQAALNQARIERQMNDLGVGSFATQESRGRTFGTLQDVARRSSGFAEDAGLRFDQDRQAARGSYLRGQQAFRNMDQMGGRLRDIAFGEGPSVAMMQGQQNADMLAARLAGGAAAARGAQGGLALRQAGLAGAQFAAQAQQQNAIAAQQERNQALAQASQAYMGSGQLNNANLLARAQAMGLADQRFQGAQSAAVNAANSENAFTENLLDRALELDLIARGEMESADARANARRSFAMDAVGMGLGAASSAASMGLA